MTERGVRIEASRRATDKFAAERDPLRCELSRREEVAHLKRSAIVLGHRWAVTRPRAMKPGTKIGPALLNKGRTSRFTKLLLRRSKVERQKEEKETRK